MRTTRRTLAAALLSAVAATATVAAGAPPASAAVVVIGAGSTWSQIAVDQWRADVARQGITINFQGVGSTAGRTQYYQDQVDFAVSEIPFQTGGDGGGINEVEQAARRPYAYLPIVAGGTSFMYHLDVAGQRVRDLRLSPDTLAKIFTGVIRSWDDPAITADNNGRRFPAIPIRVAIRSDGSGTSAQFTAYMASQSPTVWQAFCARANLGTSCGATSFYPNPPGLGFAAQQFSDGVANYVAAQYNNGAITYVEYGYAKERGFPVAAMKNRSGQYVLPFAGNVSEALKGATFNSDGTQNLVGVYTNPAPGAYPVSSYSYMIVPTTEDGRFDADKGKVLSDFILYFLCAGQQKADQLGYAPLPRVLVENGFAAVRKIPGHTNPPAITQCANPTITGGTPPPPPPPPPPAPSPGNGGQDTGTAGGGDGSGGSAAGGGTAGSDSGTGGGGSTDGTGGSTGGGTGAVAGDGAKANGRGDSGGTGDPTGGASSGDVLSASGAGQTAYASPVEYEPQGSSIPVGVYVLIALAILGAAFGPPLLSDFLRKRRAA